MTSNALRILLVEDDELFRLGLSMRLQQEPGLEVVAEAEDGETAIELANQYPLDIVLLDVGLPGIGGLETCQQLKEQHPELSILALTSRFQKPLIARLIEVGVKGYCLKGINADTLILAIRSVAMGASWWDEAATTEIQSTFHQSVQPASTPLEAEESLQNPLTRREQEILAMIAAGRSNQEIADLLYIAPGTVRVHVHSILKKLEVRDRTQAAVLAIQKELIPPDLLTD
ncbi:response regulator transcription factor [Microcoleus sp. FACHB-SPT15]|uniref:response regulator n=1 Tax=Microcoleus sp. FACHB-SPT15 TaxID=2692830 RepID=UPI00177D6C46|nr:response regulator transcription factor [Microcoleus sp. FACHB-SPT15]MBD1807514.1 response regulator transcription factor [Microcoleus sp. FACHB-SPT15]